MNTPHGGDSLASSIPLLVLQLVERLAPNSTRSKTQLAQYALRILGSRLQPPSIDDEFSLISLIKKFLINTKSMKDAVQLENLHNSLLKLNSFSQLQFSNSTAVLAPKSDSTLRCSILYLLFKLKKEKDMSSYSTGSQSNFDSSKLFLLSDLSLQPAQLSQSHPSSEERQSFPSDNIEKVQHKQSSGGLALIESKIVRDLIFVLQGLEGEYFKYRAEKDHFEIVDTVDISRSARILSYRISELGVLFSKVRNYLEQTKSSTNIGLIEQSFREGVSEEVRSYYRMISVLESQIKVEKVENSMTLRKLAVWTTEPLRRMKWLYIVIENNMESKNDNYLDTKSLIEDSKSNKTETIKNDSKNGSKSSSEIAASRMHQLTQMRYHGDPYVQTLGHTLEIYTSKPVLTMIENWIFQGLLNDPYKEFFVIKNDVIVPRVSLQIGESSKLDQNFWNWSEQYLVLHSRIPPFISHKLAHKIMVIGKSINFMKQCCGDSDWIAQITKKIRTSFDQNITNFDQLRSPIQTLYNCINDRLVHLVIDKFHLMNHVEAIRKYLFLGQGDLIQVLMESLEPELDLPPGKQYRHNLLPIVDGAIRSSVANFWPNYIQERCEIFIPNSSKSNFDGVKSSHYSTQLQPKDGWDIFELSYQLTSPLDAILGSKSVVEQHRAIFRFLWRFRRVQHILSSTWRLTTNCTRQLSYLVPEIIPLLQQVHLLRHQMTHFSSNIQYYIMFEVIETAYIQLEKDVKASKSLDEIIASYSKYMDNIIKSSLVDNPLDTPVSLSEYIDRGYEPEATPAQMIWELLDIIREFDEQIKEIYTSSHEVAVRREAAHNADPQFDENGNPIWAVTEEDEIADAEFLDHLDNVLYVSIETIADKYKHTFDQLFTLLAHRMKEDDNIYLRNLFQRINFNSFYASEAKTQLQANDASMTLQATLRSIKGAQDGTMSPSILNSGSKTGNTMSRSAAPPGFSSGGSTGVSSATMPGSHTTSAEYTENILKQAAAKLRLSNLASSAHQRSSSSAPSTNK